VQKRKSSESPESECWALLPQVPFTITPAPSIRATIERDGLLDVFTRSVVPRPRKRQAPRIGHSGSVQKWGKDEANSIITSPQPQLCGAQI
jgi:hypothetical protein